MPERPCGSSREPRSMLTCAMLPVSSIGFTTAGTNRTFPCRTSINEDRILSEAGKPRYALSKFSRPTTGWSNCLAARSSVVSHVEMSGVSYGTANMSAFKKFDPYAAASKPKEVAPKVAKVPKVARRPACHPEATLGGLGTLGGLAANIAKPWLSLGRPDNIARNRAYPSRWRVLADWTDGLERMRLKTCPITVNPKHWLRLQDVAKRFVELWGEQAAGLGWSALDIF